MSSYKIPNQQRLMYKGLSLLLIVSIIFPVSFCKNRGSSDTEIAGFSPAVAPRNAKELVEEFTKTFPSFFKEGVLKEKADEFEAAANEKLTSSQVSAASLSMLQEWLYLEIYKRNRLEYLISSLIYLLIHSEHSLDSSLKIFNEMIPEALVSKYPSLLEIRNDRLSGLVEAIKDVESRRKLLDSLRGSVEGAYISLRFLDAKKEFLNQNYIRNSNEYREKYEEIEMSRALIYSSYGMLNTKAFKSNVQPFYVKEVDETRKLTDKAINQFSETFDQFIAKRKQIDDFVNFLSSDSLKNLGEQLASALSVKTQESFRGRIQLNFNAAINELIENLTAAIKDHVKTIVLYNHEIGIMQTNLSPGVDSTVYRRWLLDVFKEAPLHFALTIDFPYLSSASTSLSDYAAQQMSSDSLRRSTNMFGVALIASLAGVGMYRNFSWLGKTGWKFVQLGFFGTEAAVTGFALYEAVGRWYEYQRMYMLSRLNPSGISLVNQIQADTMWWNVIYSGSLALIASTATLSSFTKLRASPPATRATTADESYLYSVAKGSWNNESLPLTEFVGAIKGDIASLGRSLRNMDSVASSKLSANISLNAAAIMVQTMVSIPAALPSIIKSPLSNFSKALFSSITGGLVIGVVVAATGKYMEAKGFRLFTKSVEAIGIEAPTYWKMSALDPDFRANRDAELVAIEDVRSAKTTLVGQAISLARLEDETKKSTQNPALSIKLNELSKEHKELIDETLKSQLARWYLLSEFREIRMDVFKRFGFGFNASPNIKKPRFMTLRLVVAGKTYAVTLTPEQLKEPSSKSLTDGVELSKPEIDALIQSTTQQSDNPSTNIDPNNNKGGPSNPQSP